MALNLLRMGGITALIVLCIVYPFLPGRYDGLAVGLSTMAQASGMLGLMLAPVGVVWLAFEFRKRARSRRNLPTKPRGFHFAFASVIVFSIVAAALALIAIATVGLSFGLFAAAVWIFIVLRLIPRLRMMKKAEAEAFNFAPIHLVLIPIVVVLAQFALATPASEFSRSRAIRNSAELTEAIETYRSRHGAYPRSVASVWKDYDPGMVGIERFHYAPRGNAYNLFFEQPRFLFDQLGTREFVVYNRLDEHFMISHAAWILILAPEEIEAAQGWYAVHDGPSAHWKSFWFD